MVRINHNYEDKVIVFSREKNGDSIIALINFSKEKLNVKFRENDYTGRYTNWFTKEEMDVENLREVVLQPWGYKILSHMRQ